MLRASQTSETEPILSRRAIFLVRAAHHDVERIV
jgi:hypothetical protein